MKKFVLAGLCVAMFAGLSSSKTECYHSKLILGCNSSYIGNSGVLSLSYAFDISGCSLPKWLKNDVFVKGAQVAAGLTVATVGAVALYKVFERGWLRQSRALKRAKSLLEKSRFIIEKSDGINPGFRTLYPINLSLEEERLVRSREWKESFLLDLVQAERELWACLPKFWLNSSVRQAGRYLAQIRVMISIFEEHFKDLFVAERRLPFIADQRQEAVFYEGAHIMPLLVNLVP